MLKQVKSHDISYITFRDRQICSTSYLCTVLY